MRYKIHLLAFTIALVLGLTLGFPDTLLALPADSTVVYNGIDVSRWQGEVDFGQVAQSGVSIVYIRSSYGNTEDQNFRTYTQNAGVNGMMTGFYHYLTARSVSQARYQAAFFVRTIGGYTPDCLLAMDFEDLSGLSPQEINAISLAFLQTVEELSGLEVCIYSDAYQASRILEAPLTSYPLWVAEYQVNTPSDEIAWASWSGWQYTDTGRVPGITGPVDLDYFTEEILQNSAKPVPDGTPLPNPGISKLTYRVQPGDTLWEIAMRYHTTVPALADDNGIRQPNLIYAGEVLTISIGDRTGNSPVFYTYMVKPGNTLSGIAEKYHTTLGRILALNPIRDSNLIYPGQLLYLPYYTPIHFAV